MKRILLINTGGTFSSRPGPSGLAPELTGEEITAQIGGGISKVKLEVEDYCSLDSANIRPEDWSRLALRIGVRVLPLCLPIFRQQGVEAGVADALVVPAALAQQGLIRQHPARGLEPPGPAHRGDHRHV